MKKGEGRKGENYFFLPQTWTDLTGWLKDFPSCRYLNQAGNGLNDENLSSLGKFALAHFIKRNFHGLSNHCNL